jgi:hypothetical protein
MVQMFVDTFDHGPHISDQNIANFADIGVEDFHVVLLLVGFPLGFFALEEGVKVDHLVSRTAREGFSQICEEVEEC